MCVYIMSTLEQIGYDQLHPAANRTKRSIATVLSRTRAAERRVAITEYGRAVQSMLESSLRWKKPKDREQWVSAYKKMLIDLSVFATPSRAYHEAEMAVPEIPPHSSPSPAGGGLGAIRAFFVRNFSLPEVVRLHRFCVALKLAMALGMRKTLVTCCTKLNVSPEAWMERITQTVQEAEELDNFLATRVNLGHSRVVARTLYAPELCDLVASADWTSNELRRWRCIGVVLAYIDVKNQYVFVYLPDRTLRIIVHPDNPGIQRRPPQPPSGKRTWVRDDLSDFVAELMATNKDLIRSSVYKIGHFLQDIKEKAVAHGTRTTISPFGLPVTSRRVRPPTMAALPAPLIGNSR
jgi:hypothetical protein